VNRPGNLGGSRPFEWKFTPADLNKLLQRMVKEANRMAEAA
jgi:hypothetical protein